MEGEGGEWCMSPWKGPALQSLPFRGRSGMQLPVPGSFGSFRDGNILLL